MAEEHAALSGVRVLDLTDSGYMLCGKMLADLGADVIIVEGPDGNPSRKIPPFCTGIAGKQESLYWQSYSAGKKSITLAIDTPEGRDIFIKLVSATDFVLESFRPGYMDGLGLGYSALEKINRHVIMVSITPYGQTGPKAHYKASELTVWAEGGSLYPVGDSDRPPVQTSAPQAFVVTGSQAAAAALAAYWYRQTTGEGQHLDVSAQECVSLIAGHSTQQWEEQKYIIRRSGGSWSFPGFTMNQYFPCRDGAITGFIMGGGDRAMVRSSQELTAWMTEEGAASDWLQAVDWVHDYDVTNLSQETVDRVESEVAAFLVGKTSSEVWRVAAKRNILLAPVSTIANLLENPQLAFRDFWTQVKHPSLGTLTYPGAFVQLSETPCRIRRHAPFLGEHNEEIYERKLGLGSGQIEKLREDKVNWPIRPSSQKSYQVMACKGALEGVKVLDFGWSVAAPISARYLGVLGATVIRLESHNRPDVTRLTRPFRGGLSIDHALAFAGTNSSKYSLSLNLANEKGREICWKLIDWADIMIEGYTPKVMRNWGMDYENVRQRKPEIIYAASSAYGLEGPFSSQPAYGHMPTAVGGIFALTGWPDRTASKPFMAYTDLTTWGFMITAILAALNYRRRTGKGQYIDQSQTESVIHFLTPWILDFCANKRLMERCGNRSLYAAPQGVYRCKGDDRWCAISISTDEQWAGLGRIIGEAWAKEARFASAIQRKEEENEIDSLLNKWTSVHPAEQVVELLQGAGIPAGVVGNAQDVFEDPQLKHRGHFRQLKHKVMGWHTYEAPSVRFSKTPDCQFAGPALGEHNEYVLKKILGLSDDEIADLLVEGALTTDADLPDLTTGW